MKREGRQHGMVRTYMDMAKRPISESFNLVDSPPTAGMFSKVPSKPTNHSKPTAKAGCGKPRCLQCHLHPVTKSKDKTKGTHKSDILRLNFNSTSATQFLLNHID